MDGFALTDIPPDVGEINELATGMAPGQRAADRSRITVGAVEVVVASKGVGLQDALPPGKMPVRIGYSLPAGSDRPSHGAWGETAPAAD